MFIFQKCCQKKQDGIMYLFVMRFLGAMFMSFKILLNVLLMEENLFQILI
ncbi:hypothetical protein SAMN05446037_102217 [Anaerovirgula multivorans]|uniref:Uncharacterized protein n=1 Tax=Anaerovirgula multivorans TaxID=312168 RepID=A0A239HIB8_9FIRM|nr:hypothetical protein SAMN05446037_102217 [Anaerovirgula multivorans]